MKKKDWKLWTFSVTSKAYKKTYPLYVGVLCRTKLFVRWMNGSCKETPPQKVEGEDELFMFSFFTDISANQEIIELVQTITTNIKNTLTTLTRYLNRWKKYRNIWKSEKVNTVCLKLKGLFFLI